MWVPPEIKDPILQHAPTRKSIACFGAVNLGTGQFVRKMCKVFHAETYWHFLEQLLCQRTRGRRMIIVLDKARYHHAKLLAPFLHQHISQLRLLFLPPYSPLARPDRAGVEAHSAPSDAQPLLRHARRRSPGRQHLLRPLAPTEPNPAQTMLHYLRRCV
jgi:hypothetical protein